MVNLARLLRLGQASASSRGARETGVVAAMLQAREVVGSVVVAFRRSQQARNGGSPCSLIRPARATHRYGT